MHDKSIRPFSIYPQIPFYCLPRKFLIAFGLQPLRLDKSMKKYENM